MSDVPIPCTVLIVDDEPVIRTVLAEALRRGGYTSVTDVGDADAAKAFLASHPVDVVVTDVSMPGTDGLTLMQWAQANHPGPAWIILSGHATFDHAVKAVKLGAFDFISKPIHQLETFLVSVRNALRQKRLVEEQHRLHAALEQRNGELTQRVAQLQDAFDVLTEQAETISQDLVRAERVQRALLPRQTPRMESFAFDAFYRPSQKVGGDIYDIILVDDERVAFFVADAAGHGVSAAMVAVLFKLRLRLRDERTGQALLPDQSLAEVNRAILRECTAPGLFITAALGLLNTRSGEIVLASAGHPPVLIQRSGGGAEQIPHTGPALGLSENSTYTATTHRLKPGDRMLLYTDGVTDPGEHGRGLSPAGLQAILAEPVVDRQRLLQRIVQRSTGSAEPVPNDDDLTLLLLTAGDQGSTLHNESAPAPGQLLAPPAPRSSGAVLVGTTDGRTFFQLKGRCCWTHATPFHEACRDELEVGHGVVLDLGGCDYLDSTFLGTIHEVRAGAAKAQMPMAVQSLPDGVRHYFEELAMDDVLATVQAVPLALPGEMMPLMMLPKSSQRHQQRIYAAHGALASIDDVNRGKFIQLIDLMRPQLAPEPPNGDQAGLRTPAPAP